MKKAAARLHELGQSAWLDTIARRILKNGELARLVRDDGIRGVTANPSIFEKAIAESDDYDEQLAPLAMRGQSAVEIYERLAMQDIKDACDVLRPLFDETRGGDGLVSLEVSPKLAYDADGTVAEAVRFWKEVDRPNLLVKIPATREGIPAIRRAIAEGVSVNVTLIFSVKVYEQVIDAYTAGLEDRIARALPIQGIRSVASFFVSRVDTAVDKLLGDDSLKGRIANANAKEAYALYQQSIASDRWKKLEAQGASRQRPLWASTGTKNKAYKDTLYVDELIGPDTVNTLPLATLQAFNDHGAVAETVTQGLPEARRQLSRIAELGIDIEKVCEQLTAEGVVLFDKAFDGLLHVIAARSEAMRHKRDLRWQEGLGRRMAAAEAGLKKVRDEKMGARLWSRDAKLWGEKNVAADRLGWLDVHRKMREQVKDVEAFAREAAQRFDGAVLLGMGGSSLCPDVLARIFGQQPGRLALRVLDSTAPDAVRAAVEGWKLERTLFIVASKSGSTTEVDSFRRHFESLAKPEQFIAITDPGSPLEKTARGAGYWRVFLNPADIGGRYSALSLFGLVPAALLGLDVMGMLDEAERVALASDASVPPRDNLALRLGAYLGGLAAQGADKATLVLSKTLQPFGAWIEQLVAESTGKEGKGVLPVDGEPLGKPGAYGGDRLFISISLASDGEDGIDALARAGQPVVRWTLPSKEALAGEFFRWEIATVIAGAVLGVDAFDEPNVTESKEKTRAVLAGGAASEEPALRAGGIAVFASPEHASILTRTAGVLGAEATRSPAHWLAAHLALGEPGHYVALLAYLPPGAAIAAELRRAQGAIRDATKLTVTSGFGPRFLHSTGQLHKGGPPTGLFVELTVAGGADIPIPGIPYGFATLFAAQARGDLEVLQARGRRALRLHAEDGDAGKLITLLHEAARLVGRSE